MSFPGNIGQYVDLGRVGSGSGADGQKYSTFQLRLYQTPDMVSATTTPITTYSDADSNMGTANLF